jgi:hypothetical protein
MEPECYRVSKKPCPVLKYRQKLKSMHAVFIYIYIFTQGVIAENLKLEQHIHLKVTCYKQTVEEHRYTCSITAPVICEAPKVTETFQLDFGRYCSFIFQTA